MRYTDVTPYATNSSNAGAWIFLIIFFGIIIALVIVAVIGAKKDKIEKMIENDKRKKIRSQASSDRIALFSSLNEIVTNLEKEIADFKPSVGTKSLGDINREASDRIKSFIKSDALKTIYLSDDYRIEIRPIMDLLSTTKPSNWEKQASFATGLVKAKYSAIEKVKDNEEQVNRGKNLDWINEKPEPNQSAQSQKNVQATSGTKL